MLGVLTYLLYLLSKPNIPKVCTIYECTICEFAMHIPNHLAKVRLFSRICNIAAHFSVLFVETRMEKCCRKGETDNKAQPDACCTHAQ